MAERDYMSGPHDSDKCSCRHDGVHWLKRCAAATANDRAESQRWLLDHVRRSPDVVFDPEFLVSIQPTMAGPDAYCAKPNEDLR